MAESQGRARICPLDVHTYTIPSGDNIVEYLKRIIREGGFPRLSIISCIGQVQKVELKKRNGDVEVHTDEEGPMVILNCNGKLSCLNGNIEEFNLIVWLHTSKSEQGIAGGVGDEMIARGNVKLVVGVAKSNEGMIV